jgi:hypothetical protein
MERLLRLQQVENSIIFRSSANKGGKVVSSTQWPPLLPPPPMYQLVPGYQSYTYVHDTIESKVPTRHNSKKFSRHNSKTFSRLNSKTHTRHNSKTLTRHNSKTLTRHNSKTLTRHYSKTKRKVASIPKLETKWMLAVSFTRRSLCHREQILRCRPEAVRKIWKIYSNFAPTRNPKKIPWKSSL